MTDQSDIEKWIEEFNNSPTVQALSAAFSAFSYLKGAYDVFTSIFYPEPNLADLIVQAKEEILREIREVVVEHWVSVVDGLIETYKDYVLFHDPDFLDELIISSNDAIAHLQRIILEEDLRSACLVAEAYNLLIPLMGTIRLQEAAHQKASGVDIDWDLVNKRNMDMFSGAIEINKVLLGSYMFDELPNIPCYAYPDGKLEAWRRNDKPSVDEYKRIREIVWQANEHLRCETIPGYNLANNWFTISRSPDSGFLIGSPEDETVDCVNNSEPDIQNKLWQFEYQSSHSVRIIHWSGMCLTEDKLDLSALNYRPLRLCPYPANEGEFNYIALVREIREARQIQHYYRSWKNGHWYRKEKFGSNISSAPAAFLNKAPGSEFNIEVFAREGHKIQHYYYSQRDGKWHKGQSFGKNVKSAPAAFQNFARGSEFNYEVFVREGNQIQHYFRNWKDGKWYKGQRFGAYVVSAPAAFQNRIKSVDKYYKIKGPKYPSSLFNYEVFVRERDHIQHYFRCWDDGKWRKGQSFGTGVLSAPASFQNRADDNANFEVFVREGNQIQHYWHSWYDDKWHKGQRFGTNVLDDPAVFQNQAPSSEYNYEVFVREGNQIRLYYRNWRNGKWYKGQCFSENVSSGPAVFQNVDFREGQSWNIQDYPIYFKRNKVLFKLLYNFVPPGEEKRNHYMYWPFLANAHYKYEPQKVSIDQYNYMVPSGHCFWFVKFFRNNNS